jgi:hypothetical protein
MGLVTGAAMLSATGCEIPGIVASAVVGPARIPAVYEPLDRPTVVFVDDPANRLPSREMATLLAGRIGEQLVENEVVAQVIPPIIVERLRANHEEFGKWPIDKIGQQSGARQVLYVLVQDCRIAEDDLIYHPTLTVRIKVIDAESGARLFPEAATALAGEGHLLQHATTYRDMTGATEATRTVLMRELMEQSAVHIAQLFYKHRAPEPGSRLPK